jgi:hypothetical protein
MTFKHYLTWHSILALRESTTLWDVEFGAGQSETAGLMITTESYYIYWRIAYVHH